MSTEQTEFFKLDPEVLRAREQLAQAMSEWSTRLRRGESPWTIARNIVKFREEWVIQSLRQAAEKVGATEGELSSALAIVAHSGFARGDLAPYSDTDLLFLFAGRQRERYRDVVRELLRHLTDRGLVVGHYPFTLWEAWRLSAEDPLVFTSFCEIRLIWGNEALFRRFVFGLRVIAQVYAPCLYRKIVQARAEERERFGETAYLNEPHVKRSHGALRDIHMIRWLGILRAGLFSAKQCPYPRILTHDDLHRLQDAWTFLLRIRQWMHFEAGYTSDVLTRWQQLRLAEDLGYAGGQGLLPAEDFMREYFRHTYEVGRCLGLAVEELRPFIRLRRTVQRLLGRRLRRDWIVTRGSVLPTRRGWGRLGSSLEAVLELSFVSMTADKPVEAYVWEHIRAAHAERENELSPQARDIFWKLLGGSLRLGEILAQLHEAGILERFVPGLARAKGLLQFNQYHKYTVDRHCLRAVAWAANLHTSGELLGQVYRQISRKAVLHLALLMHDLGKGFEEDHREVGKRLAEEAARRLNLTAEDAEDLLFLVAQHLLMNHLAFRRDINDEQLVVRFAVDVASAERLAMLFVLTAADLAAVGPGGWNSWKADVLSDLYQRALRYLTGDILSVQPEVLTRQRKERVAEWLGPLAEQEFFARQLAQLPTTYLTSTPPWRIAEDLRLLSRLRPDEVHVEVRWNSQRETVALFLATNEAIGPGIFHKLVGAISSEGWEILAADIHTLEGGWVIDRVEARDPDYLGKPPEDRLKRVAEKVRHSVISPGPIHFRFRHSWFSRPAAQATVAKACSRVHISNRISPHFTVIDVFAVDRPGLLFTIAKTLFELGLSVARARIGTYLDQVVDVFYVTDAQGKPIVGDEKLEVIRQSILSAVENPPKQQ